MDKNKNDRHIVSYYQTVTSESVEHGDFAEQGEAEIYICEPNKYDIEEGITAIDLAVKVLRDQGPVEASSSSFHKDVWYSSVDAEEDYQNGEKTYYTFHLLNFTELEEAAIYMMVTGQRPKLKLVKK